MAINGTASGPERYGHIVTEFARVVGVPAFCLVVVIAWWISLEAGWIGSISRENGKALAVQLKALERIETNQAQATRDLARALEAVRFEGRSQISLATCLSYAKTADIQVQCLERYRSSLPSATVNPP